MLVRVLRGNAADGSFLLPENIHITRKEITALVLVAMGWKNEEGAKKFGVSVNTFRNHVFNAMKKLGAKSREHAIILAIQNGIIEVAEKRTLESMKSYTYYACTFCQRAFRKDEVMEVEGKTIVVNHVKATLPKVHKCPYDDCTGDILDAVPWEYMRKEHPEYPEIPERGVVYDFDLEKYLIDRGYVLLEEREDE